MTNIYPAVLCDNVLEWSADAPRHYAPGTAVKVWVTISEESGDATSRGQRMADALEKIAQSRGLAGVDGAQWQREVRAERTLPGRDE